MMCVKGLYGYIFVSVDNARIDFINIYFVSRFYWSAPAP